MSLRRSTTTPYSTSWTSQRKAGAAPASPQDRYAAGKRLRERVPREAHAAWQVKRDSGRLDPLEVVNRGRLPELLPEKHKRMRASPFAFFRGAAAVMAADLATTPIAGPMVQLCGDAHVRNLGAYQALDGALVFDLNDFDETIPGPWEWDVKRLATSFVLAGEAAGQSADRCAASVRRFVASYRQHLGRFGEMAFATLARYRISRRHGNPILDEIFRAAERVTPLRNLQKLTVHLDHGYRFHDGAPVLRPVSPRAAAEVMTALGAYRETLNPGRRRTFERYRPVDVAFKVAGTGSVGTRDYIILLFGNGIADPLFIQMKQEMPSCYVPYLRHAPPISHEGRRVAEGQQSLQTLSDPFLGYSRFGGHDYLVRQLADHKAGFDPATFTGRTLGEYAALCGEVLAKGHARTGDGAQLAGYAGKSTKLDEAIAAFATAYAEQVRHDYRVFRRTHGASRVRQRPAPRRNPG